ncbi:hypothetical protein MTO96_019490 [Rhipicephalus appendiculatus]
MQRLSLSRGKVLGGSSVLNFMMYTRGNPQDYEAVEYHGTGGEVPVDYANTSTLLSHLLLKACNESGYTYVDYNGPTQTGCSRAQANVASGERFSSSRAFIQPIVGTRKNLHVALFSRVTKIPIVADLPVGRNLQDHVVLEMAPPVSTDVNAGIPPFGLKDIQQYDRNKTGTISIPTSVEFMQFLHSGDNATDADIPDIEVVAISTSPASQLFKAMMVELGLMPEAFDAIIGPTDGRPGFRSLVILNRPMSRGSITLRSADPYDDPDIDPRNSSTP